MDFTMIPMNLPMNLLMNLLMNLPMNLSMIDIERDKVIQ